MKKETVKKLDELARILKGASPDKLASLLKKTEMITMRVTLVDKVSMQRTAKACGITMTEYLITIHHFVAERLKRARK